MVLYAAFVGKIIAASSGHVSDARRVESRVCGTLNAVYSVSMVAFM